MSVYIYILIVTSAVTVYVSCEAIDQSDQRMTDHEIGILRVKLVKSQFEHLLIKSPF